MRLLPVVLILAVAGCSFDRAFRTEEELAQKNEAAPDPSLPAHLARAAPLRSAPDAGAPARRTLAAGAEVTASEEAVRGFRRVRTADGQTGYVEAGAIAGPPGGEGRTATR